MPTPKPSSRRRPQTLIALAALAACLALPAGAAAAWTREAAPTPLGSGFSPTSMVTMLPDGSAVWLGNGARVGGDYTTQLIRRPAAGPAAYASPFPSALGQSTSSGALELSRPDAAGNLLVVRRPSPNSAAFLPLGADPAGVTIEPTPNQVTAIDLAPSGEAAAIVSKGSGAGVSFRAAGPAGRFDTPRWFVTSDMQRSYAVAVTVDPDGGIFAIYETQQPLGLFQVYAPPGGDFGAPQLIDVDQVTLNLEDFQYAQSSNGNGLFVWDEDTGGSSNAERIWAMTRAPGGLLGGKSLVAQSPDTSHLVSSTYLGITDDGSQYVAYLHGNPISGCPTNIDGDTGGALAWRSAGGPWAREVYAATWPDRGEVNGIATQGNAVVITQSSSRDTDARCTESDPTSSIAARIGTGASLGPATVIASEAITSGGKNGNVVRTRGLDINAGGAAIALTEEPIKPGVYSTFVNYFDGSPVAIPISGGKLPPPGRIKLGSRLVAKEGRIAFISACISRPNEGNKTYCLVGADLLEERHKGNIPTASASAVKKKGKKKGKGKGGKKAKPKVLARAKPVKIPAGKQRKVVLVLNKLGKKRLKAAGKKGLRVKLRVTIRKGSQKQTITRKVKLVAGKAKKKGKKKKKR